MMTNHTRLDKQKLIKIIDSLEYDFSKFDLESFIAKIETTFNRRICLIGMSFCDGIQGIWLSSDDTPLEYIFFEKSLSPVHCLHVKLHELGHFLCGHKTHKLTRADVKNLITEPNQNTLKEFSHELIRFRDSSNCSTKDLNEMEAEYIANVIQSMIVKKTQLMNQVKSNKTTAKEIFDTLGLN